MDYQQIALGFHLLGFALGLGGATISDISFLSNLVRLGFADCIGLSDFLVNLRRTGVCTHAGFAKMAD
jgi:hypothetical protein